MRTQDDSFAFGSVLVDGKPKSALGNTGIVDYAVRRDGNARMKGDGTAVTAEVGCAFTLQNGLLVKPNAGFSGNRATFDSVSGPTGAPPPYTLSVGPVVSELGVLSMQEGYRTSAGGVPGRAASAPNDASAVPFDFVLNTGRGGTFGQVGVGVAASPLKLPSLLMYVGADYRSGESLTEGGFTFGARYSF